MKCGLLHLDLVFDYFPESSREDIFQKNSPKRTFPGLQILKNWAQRYFIYFWQIWSFFGLLCFVYFFK